MNTTIITDHRSDQMLTLYVQKKVQLLLTGVVASDRNFYILFTGVCVDDFLTRSAAADVGGCRSRTDVHPGVDLTLGILASAGTLSRRLLCSEVEQRHVDCLTVRNSDKPRT